VDELVPRKGDSPELFGEHKGRFIYKKRRARRVGVKEKKKGDAMKGQRGWTEFSMKKGEEIQRVKKAKSRVHESELGRGHIVGEGKRGLVKQGWGKKDITALKPTAAQQ